MPDKSTDGTVIKNTIAIITDNIEKDYIRNLQTRIYRLSPKKSLVFSWPNDKVAPNMNVVIYDMDEDYHKKLAHVKELSKSNPNILLTSKYILEQPSDSSEKLGHFIEGREFFVLNGTYKGVIYSVSNNLVCITKDYPNPASLEKVLEELTR